MSARCPFLAQLEQMPRLTEARYADGLGELYEQQDPLDVALGLFAQGSEDIPNSGGLSTLFTTWGQFLDHDLSLTPEDEHGEEIAVDGFARDIARSEALDGTGETGPLQFGNAITWQIDGSQIYGSNDVRETDVRSFEDGKLRMIDDPTSTHGLLPLATEDTVMAGDTSGDDAVFLAGDIRASENPNLLSLHTLFAREHNYWAERLAEENPDWSDQDLFEVARSIVEYELQAITYDEWLPHLIGNTLPDEIAHDPDADGQVSLEFSTAAFRFGHTLVSGHMPRLNEDGSIFADGHLELLDSFFNPEPVKTGGIDSLIRGQAALHAQEFDTKVIDDLNFFLATPDGVGGFSLPALNLIRGADHGMGSYLEVRAQLLGDIDPEAVDPEDFSVITADPELQAELAGVYESVHQVDLWVGGLAEDNLDGAQSGPLFHFILSDQFYRTAAADQTFGELDPRLSEALLAEVKASGMKEVILRTTDIDHLQDDPFLTAPRGLTFSDMVLGTPEDDEFAFKAAAVSKTVRMGAGDDTVTITGGSDLRAKVLMGDGEDKVFMSSGRVGNDIDMGRADDREVVDLSGTAFVRDDVQTGAGNDAIRMDGVARVGDDVITRAGNDKITVAGKAAIEGALNTGAGDDDIKITEGAEIAEIQAGDGDDTLLLLDEATAAEIEGGKGFDILGLGARDFRIEATGEGQGTVVFLDAEGQPDGNETVFSGVEVVGGLASSTSQADLFVGTHEDELFRGWRGDDSVFGLGGNDVLAGNQGDDLLAGGDGDDKLRGGANEDLLEGGDGKDNLGGNNGDDTLIGGNGNDWLHGGRGNDSHEGGAGDDFILGNVGNDTAFGNSGDDTLIMGYGNDTARGGTGDDTLDGGAGINSLSGGAGADTFQANTALNAETTITDFSDEDALILSKMSDEEVIDILTGQNGGTDTVLSSSLNANWRIVLENVDEFEEDDILFS
ncbi:MAG: peroxidase family protein [Pseudomonadota bacterium]